MDNKLVVSRKKKQAIVEELAQRKYEPFRKHADNKKTKSDEEEVEGLDEEEVETDAGAQDYDYLLAVGKRSTRCYDTSLILRRCLSGLLPRNALTV
jgi:hypothetical protein